MKGLRGPAPGVVAATRQARADSRRVLAHLAAGDKACWCGQWYTPEELDQLDALGTCGAAACVAAEVADRHGLVP